MSRERTEILYLAPWVDLGGSDKGTIDWFRHLDRERFAASLITTQPSPNRWVRKVEPYAEEVWSLPDVLAGDSFPNFILGFIESRGVRVVHVMNSRLAFDLLPDIAALPDPPIVVVQLHAEEPGHGGYVRYAATRYAGLVDCFSVTSQHLAETMRSYDVPDEKLAVIYTGVDAHGEFNPETAVPHEAVNGDRPAVLWPGRLVEQKDPMLTLEVVRELRDRGVAFTLHVVGDGWLRDDVHRRTDELGLRERVRFHPPSQDMAAWYRASDLMLMTSVFEGVPYVVFEALAMGVPVVAPALPGNVELIDEDSGRLIEPRDDIRAYADAIQEVLEAPEQRRRMGRSARRRMLEEFSVERMVREHETLYERLLEPQPRRPAAREAPQPPPEPVRLSRREPRERTVAVLVPCFRHGRYLDACLGSIRAQTLPAAQIILVDDASDDETTQRALERVEAAGDVEVLRLPENSGPSVARNRGLELVRSNYVLPLDADDLLLPEALETMVEQLERAPDDVAFVYPNAQHFGNRHDYVEMPDWNLFLETFENVCPATSLFDARIFEAGVHYPEDIRIGHEDWDVVLQIASRGLRGTPARGRTFLYRKRGFSRVDTVHLGEETFASRLPERHPALFARRAELKAAHAPALSLILLPGPEPWPSELRDALARGTCRDAEIISTFPTDGEAGAPHWVRRPDPDGDVELWAAQALEVARGTLVAIATPRAFASLRRRDGLEWIIRALDTIAVDAIVLLDQTEGTPPGFALLDEHVAGDPCLLAFKRSRLPGRSREVVLGESRSVLFDLATAIEVTGALQFRAAVQGS